MVHTLNVQTSEDHTQIYFNKILTVLLKTWTEYELG
jgi:hypothetical protein